MPPPRALIVSYLLVLVANSVLGQRSSPQFSFPPPGPLTDVFTSSNGHDLSLSQPPAPIQPVPVPLGASSMFSAPNMLSLDQSLASVNPQPQIISQPSSAPPANPAPAPTPSRQLESSREQKEVASTQLSRPTLSLSSLSAQTQSSSRPTQSQAGSSASQSQAQSQAQSHSQATATHQINRHQSSQASSHRTSNHQTREPSSSNGNNNNNAPRPSLQTQQTSQAANAQSNQAAIEAARRAEATAASLAASSGQTYQCPDSFGFFRHHKSCDKYWACENGTATLKLCGNGLMFDDLDPKRENCAYPFSVDCGSDRTDLEPPISTPHCPRLYGLFPDPTNCRVFYSCWNGESSKYECPPGLAYDNEQRVCVWADLVDRCDQSEVSDGFVCPDPTEVDQPGHYTRHAHPTDCRKFYVCIEGVARPYGCSLGTVFNVDSLQCDEPENVSGCEKYYGDMDPKLAKKLARENAQGNPPSSSSSTSTSSSSRSTSQANH